MNPPFLNTNDFSVSLKCNLDLLFVWVLMDLLNKTSQRFSDKHDQWYTWFYYDKISKKETFPQK
jgi:hypothetical protein